MSMSTRVIGIRPADGKFKDMLAAWKACEAVGERPPQKVQDFFNGEYPDPAGIFMYLDGDKSAAKYGVKPYKNEDSAGFEVELSKLPPDIKIIRCVNSW